MKEGNEVIIADFIGKRLYTKQQIKDHGYEQQWEFSFCDGYWPSVKTMKFQEEWSWFMPVVEKINSLFDRGEMSGFDTDIYKSMQEWVLAVKLEYALADAVTIIEWYNKQGSPAPSKVV